MKILVIGANCIAHLAKHSKKGLTYGEMETGVIFGFLEQIKILNANFGIKPKSSILRLYIWEKKRSFPEFCANFSSNFS